MSDVNHGQSPQWLDYMARCQADPRIERVSIGGFQFPLGVYPVEADQPEFKPREGFTVAFEPADGDGGDGEWEEWPDRYVFDILVSAGRLDGVCRSLFALLPGRIYPILDVLGQDAYREIDPYVSYELLGQERFLDSIRRYRDFLLEDGLVGFGAMSEEPFMYIFVDEHKILTLRIEAAYRDRVEAVLAAYDLQAADQIQGADAATHEHRSVLLAPDDRPDLANAEEIIEILKDEWRLTLNVDPDTNVDEDGNDLGITPWRCIVRRRITNPDQQDSEATEHEESPPRQGPDEVRYAEVLLTAESLSEAEQLSIDAVSDDSIGTGAGDEGSSRETESQIVLAERMLPESFRESLRSLGMDGDVKLIRVWNTRWLD